MRPAGLKAAYALVSAGNIDAAAAAIKAFLSEQPDQAQGYYDLGVLQFYKKRLSPAARAFAQAATLKSGYFEALRNLSVVWRRLGDHDNALNYLTQAVDLRPSAHDLIFNLGNTYRDLGQLAEAIACYRRVLEIKPDFWPAHSNMLLNEQYREGHTAASLFELHAAFGKKFPTSRSVWPADADRLDPERRLRIGFLSPDLGTHPVGFFLIGPLAHFDRTKLETYCYSDRQPDTITHDIQQMTDHWRESVTWSDDALIERINEDRIDILFDLAGHTARNRLPMFARKPAPLSVTWAGYVGTTGLGTIDYLLVDRFVSVDEEKYYSEKILRMPDSWTTYTPPPYAPACSPLPARTNGFTTFGSFSNPNKINASTIDLWAQILRTVPNAVLILKYNAMDSPHQVRRITALFAANGIGKERFILEGGASHADFIARYADIDLALDTFPYSGGLTTYEALWMGVPVVAKNGATFASRHALGILQAVGLPELVGEDASEYLDKAVSLATDWDRLASMRDGLRTRVAASPVCDHAGFAAHFTDLMRAIWRQFCANAVA